MATRPLWVIRLSREMPRYLLGMAALAGLAASARFAIAPPRAAPLRVIAPASAGADRAAEGYAVLFVRRYLTWNASAPQQATQGLGSYGSSTDEAGAPFVAPPTGEQRVEWAEVVQARERARGEHVYTVAAQTDSAGLLYLSVGVARAPAGTLSVSGYPGFVGAPAAAPAPPAPHLREVSDGALLTVATRALRNYLAGSSGELAADLAGGARVSPPGLGLTLEALQRLEWAPDGRSVRAVLQAQDGRGAQYTLGYELDVVRDQGRWEVSAVQMDPFA
jgi:Conjugative transposon protein TcpC